MSRSRRYIFIVIIMLAGFGVWVHNLNRPFVGHFDLMNTAWTLYADHTLEYGVIGVRFGDVYQVAPTTYDNFYYVNNHPPMITHLLLPGRAFVGDSELATRITPVFISLLAGAALYTLAERLFRKHGLLALFFFMFTPTVVYFSNIITQELTNLLWILLALWCYSYWLEDQSPKWRNRLLMLALLGGWTDWVYYFFVVYMLIHAIWAVGWKRARGLWSLLAALVFTELLYLVVNLWQRPDFIEAFTQSMFGRLTDSTGSGRILPTGYPGFGRYLVLMVVRIFQVFTPALVLLTIMGALLMRKERRKPIRESKRNERRRKIIQWGLPLLPAATTLTFMLVLQREAHYIHDFLVYHLVIPFTIYSAYTYRRILYSSGTPSLKGNAVLSVLLGLFLLSSFMQFRVYRELDYRPERAEWGQIIAPYVEPGERIAGNVVYSWENHRNTFGLTMGYYAGTDAVWSMSYEQFLDTGGDWVGFYVYCMPTISDRTLNPDDPLALPDELDEVAVTVFEHDGCWFADLRE